MVLVDVICHCVLTSQKASCILGCIKSSVASRVREGVVPLCSTLVLTIISSVPMLLVLWCFVCLHYLGNEVAMFNFLKLRHMHYLVYADIFVQILVDAF